MAGQHNVSALQTPVAAEIPDDLVEMGFVTGACGIRGWVNVVADTEYADSLFNYETWWLGRNGRWQAYTIEEGHVQPKKLAAKLSGVDDRDMAFALKGMQVAVPRSALPKLDSDDEFYWADLIGLKVMNVQGESLGVVDKLFETGANDVLVVKDGVAERLLPFVAHVVLKVDRDANCITVDWGLDY